MDHNTHYILQILEEPLFLTGTGGMNWYRMETEVGDPSVSPTSKDNRSLVCFSLLR